MNKILINIKGLTKYFTDEKGKRSIVLQDVNLQILRGEVLSIIAPSGFGKSTLLNIIAGISGPSGGVIEMPDDIDIGYMFQKEVLLPWRNVLNNILLGVEIKNKDIALHKRRARKLLERFDLGATEHLYPHELSGGMHQRVALIQTLIYEPSLLLFDEPFSSLDYVSKLKLEIELYRFIKSKDMTAILVTHDIEEAITLSDRIILFKDRPLSQYDEFPVILAERDDPSRIRRSEIFTDLFSHFWNFFERQMGGER